MIRSNNFRVELQQNHAMHQTLSRVRASAATRKQTRHQCCDGDTKRKPENDHNTWKKMPPCPDHLLVLFVVLKV